MAYTIWSLITWVFLPLGGVIAACILSGCETLERVGIKMSKMEIQLGFLSFTVPAFVSCISTGCVFGEWAALSRLQTQRLVSMRSSLEFNNEWRAGVWRHQRNWYACLFFNCF